MQKIISPQEIEVRIKYLESLGFVKSNFSNEYVYIPNENIILCSCKYESIISMSNEDWKSLLDLYKTQISSYIEPDPINQIEVIENKEKTLSEKIADSQIKINRPDLSFITSQKFEKNKDYINWIVGLSDEEINMVFNFQMQKLPELIQCAEMLFDEHKHNPDSLVFKAVSKTLNINT